MMRRSAKSMRSSSSPCALGAPPDRMSFPPSLSMSVPTKQRSRSSTASCVMRTSASRASTAPIPSRSTSASVPSKWMNATVALRCSGSRIPAKSPSRTASGMHSSTMAGSTSGEGSSGSDETPAGARASSLPAPSGGPSTRSGRAAAASALARISPALAVFSISTVRVAAGPATMSSLFELPTTKKWYVPVCMPTDMRSRTVPPAVVSIVPTSRRVRRIHTAERAARSRCPSPENQSSRASPPNFSRPPPFAYATASRAAKQEPIASVSSSAPSLPILASFSESAVNPEMSTKTMDPSWAQAGSSGVSESCRINRRGT